MTPVKKLLLATVALSALAGTALAADLPYRRGAPMPVGPAFVAVPVFTWSGLYVGLNAGYGFSGDSNITTSGNQAGTAANVSNGFRAATIKNEREGFVGGGQIGYNYQIGALVLGLETDIQYTDFDTTSGYRSFRGDVSSYNNKMDYLGTVRGRVGYAMDRWMIYATGGLAYGDVNNSAVFNNFVTGLPQFAGGRSGTETGYTVGGGVEYAMPAFNFGGSAATIKLEYLYYDLGSRNITVANVAGNGTSYNARFNNDGHIVRAGLNWKFGGF
jgi:outer membrane immunogenic protein